MAVTHPITSLRSGDITASDPVSPAGLQAVFIANRAKLIGFFAGRTRDPAEAEDVVQEIYLKLQKNPDAPIADPLPYLYRIGLNIVIDRSRERKRRARREEGWSDATVSVMGGTATDERPSPFAELEAKQDAQNLAAAIGQLPPGARRAFELHKLQGLTHAQVAEQLGISRSGVEKHIAVAFRHLARILEE